MRERALIHVAGPEGSGKTTFVEALLGVDRLILAARCIRDDALRHARETWPRSHPELRRYRQAGASGAAVFSFPESDIGSEAFYTTELMGDYSDAVVLEGDSPVAFADLSVFVTRALASGEKLLVRRKHDRAREARAEGDAMEALLRRPDGIAGFVGQMFGGPIVEMARQRPQVFEDARSTLLAAIAAARKGTPPKPAMRWAIADGYSGIERAQLVVVNIRDDAEREGGERLVNDIARLRKDAAVFRDIIGLAGNKIPVTAVVADLRNPADPGRKKAIARVERAFRTR